MVQHGKFNNRIYLMKYHKDDQPYLFDRMNELVNLNGYSKIIAKIPAWAQPIFLIEGYSQEAYIPGFYKGTESACFMAKYFDPERSVIPNKSLSTLAGLLSDPQENNSLPLPKQLTMEITEPRHVREMAEVYQQVFKTYPFPITDADYLEKTMKDGSVIYFGIRDQGKLIGLSSAEMDIPNKNAEMTDFAILPKYRGQKLALFLLGKMEEEMRKKQFQTLYTIARLDSPGMNKTFINHNYHFSGVLKNNTNISGQIESMNVYYKTIKK